MARVVALRVAILGVAVLLLWRVLHVNAVVYGEENRPRMRVTATSPVTAAHAALRENPADIAALLIAAVRYEEAGDAKRAGGAYANAVALAPVDRATLRAAAGFELRQGRGAGAIAHLDRLAEYHDGTHPWVFAQVEALVGSAPERAALEALAARSAWIGPFIQFACGRPLEPRLMTPLVLRRVAAKRAKPAEAACVIERLRAAGHWTDAYQLWLNTLPRERLADVGFVFNGGFEQPPSGHGFDWIAERTGASTADFMPGPGAGGQRALRVTWSGKRIGAPALRQFLALAPGRYELQGRARLEGLQSVRGIQWIVRCAPPAKRSAPLGASERFIGSGEWARFAFEVVVPPECAGQVIQVEPSGLNEGTTYVAGKAWFDDLRLARAR